MGILRIGFIGLVAGCVLYFWHLVGGYVISTLVGMPGFTPYRTLLEFILLPVHDIPAQWTILRIAADLALGVTLAFALTAPLGRRARGCAVALAAALVAAALVEVPQVGLVQFDETTGGLSHIPKRYGLGALLVSVSSVAAAVLSIVSLEWVLQFVGRPVPPDSPRT